MSTRFCIAGAVAFLATLWLARLGFLFGCFTVPAIVGVTAAWASLPDAATQVVADAERRAARAEALAARRLELLKAVDEADSDTRGYFEFGQRMDPILDRIARHLEGEDD